MNQYAESMAAAGSSTLSSVFTANALESPDPPPPAIRSANKQRVSCSHNPFRQHSTESPSPPQPAPPVNSGNIQNRNVPLSSSPADHHPYGHRASSSPEHGHDSEEKEEEADDLKYPDFSYMLDPSDHPFSATKSSGVVIPDDVPFAISSLFTRTTDPNPITTVSAYRSKYADYHRYHHEHHHGHDAESKEDEKSDRVLPVPPPPPSDAVKVGNLHQHHIAESIEEKRNEMEQNRMLTDIIVLDTMDNNKERITMFPPNGNGTPIHRETSGMSYDAVGQHSPSPNIDFELETTPSIKPRERRPSVQLGTISEQSEQSQWSNHTNSPAAPSGSDKTDLRAMIAALPDAEKEDEDDNDSDHDHDDHADHDEHKEVHNESEPNHIDHVDQALDVRVDSPKAPTEDSASSVSDFHGDVEVGSDGDSHHDDNGTFIIRHHDAETVGDGVMTPEDGSGGGGGSERRGSERSDYQQGFVLRVLFSYKYAVRCNLDMDVFAI